MPDKPAAREAPLPTWSIGTARTDITAYEPGQLLFGWGDERGRARRVGERLHARVVVIRTQSPDHAEAGAIAVACLDLSLVSTLLRESILDRLAAAHPDVRLDRRDTLICATHTHSAPAGLTDSPLYEMMNHGFSPDVFSHIVQRTADALASAWRTATPGRVRFARIDAPALDWLAVNRSPRAHSRNPEARSASDATKAVDRHFTVLRLEDPNGRERGMVSWHGTHGTSIHAGQTALHPDHKGMAATLLEDRRRRQGNPDYVAVFAQGAAGDVTPNHRWCSTRKRTVGRTDDDEANCLALARTQVDLAEQALQLARESAPLSGPLGGRIRVTDLADAPVLPRFTGGMGAARTRGATLGVGFLSGTLEGPGPLGTAGHALRLLSRNRRRRHHRDRWSIPRHRRWAADPMVAFSRLGAGVHGDIFGMKLIDLLPKLARLDSTFAWVHGAHRAAGTLDRPWLSGRVHAQVLQIGRLAIVGVPGEPTVVAGLRLRRTVEKRLQNADTVVITGYANGYAGYVTTPEEYDEQQYEGGSTLFGRWTLGALQTTFESVAAQPLGQRGMAGPPLEYPDLEILVREREAGRAGMGRFAHRVREQRLGTVHGRV